jgi:hypothetical protein
MGVQIRSYFVAGLGQIVAFLPHLLSAVIILVVGYVLSRLAGSLARRLLARVRFDGYIARRLHPRASAPGHPASTTVGSAVFWLGMLVTLSLTTRALQLASLSAGIDRILSYVPRPYEGRVLLFRPDSRTSDPRWGWGPYATGPLEVHAIPSEGAVEAMIGPGVPLIADILKERIR